MACDGFYPETDAPKDIARRLRSFGGDNPFHQPNWRLCLADHRYDMRGGIFHEMPDGKVQAFERDPKTGRLQYTPITPKSVKHGVFPTPKYDVQGWILERWFPASTWGSREWWTSQKAEDGITPILGEYPAEGDYFMLCGPWERLPEMDDIEQAIARYEYEMRSQPIAIDLLFKSLTNDAERKKVAKQRAFEAELQAFYHAEIAPIYTSTTLAGSRLRQEAAKAAGQTSHVTL